MNKVMKASAIVVSFVMITLAFTLSSVFATGGGVPFSPVNNGTTGTPTTGNNPGTGNTTNGNTTSNTTNTNTTNTNTMNTTNRNTTANTNTINNNLVKDKEELPKTGEFDIYIISVVAVAVVLVGGFAFVKSRKIN